MLPFDLPPEMFQRIVHELVLDVGVKEVWKLRSVSRTFADEIHNDIFAHQPKEVLLSYLDSSRDCKILKNNFSAYLRNRMKTRLDVDGVLVPKLKELWDYRYLMEKLHIQNFDDRQNYATQLIAGILQDRNWNWKSWVQAFVWDVETMFTHNAKRMKGRPATAAEKLRAAVAINAHSLVPSLFEESMTEPHTEFAQPLMIATKRGYTDMMRTLLECYKKSFSLDNAHPHKFDAIDEAIKISNVGAVKLLIQSCTPWDQRYISEKVMRQIWMNDAAETGSDAVLDATIETKGGRTTTLNQEVAKAVCRYGTVSLINHYIEAGLLNVNKTWSHTSPLVHAVEKGSHGGNDHVITLLSAGADINKATGNGSTALFVALKRNDRVTANYLLDRGAHTNTNGWPPYHNSLTKRRLTRILADRAAAQPSATQTRNS